MTNYFNKINARIENINSAKNEFDSKNFTRVAAVPVVDMIGTTNNNITTSQPNFNNPVSVVDFKTPYNNCQNELNTLKSNTNVLNGQFSECSRIKDSLSGQINNIRTQYNNTRNQYNGKPYTEMVDIKFYGQTIKTPKQFTINIPAI